MGEHGRAWGLGARSVRDRGRSLRDRGRSVRDRGSSVRDRGLRVRHLCQRCELVGLLLSGAGRPLGERREQVEQRERGAPRRLVDEDLGDARARLPLWLLRRGAGLAAGGAKLLERDGVYCDEEHLRRSGEIGGRSGGDRRRSRDGLYLGAEHVRVELVVDDRVAAQLDALPERAVERRCGVGGSGTRRLGLAGGAVLGGSAILSARVVRGGGRWRRLRLLAVEAVRVEQGLRQEARAMKQLEAIRSNQKQSQSISVSRSISVNLGQSHLRQEAREQPPRQVALAAAGRVRQALVRRRLAREHAPGGRPWKVSGRPVEGHGRSVEGDGRSVEGDGRSVEGHGRSVEGDGRSVEGVPSESTHEGCTKRLSSTESMPSAVATASRRISLGVIPKSCR